MNPTNLQIANWLDPEHKRKDWWTSTRPSYELGGDNTAYFAASDEVKYTGPDFYAPGVCEEEVVPVVLAVKDLFYERDYETTEIKCYINNHADPDWRIIHGHHPTAINLALAKIKEADHA